MYIAPAEVSIPALESSSGCETLNGKNVSLAEDVAVALKVSLCGKDSEKEALTLVVGGS
jgi:hypothetical protein